jgi:hypothetical protein
MRIPPFPFATTPGIGMLRANKRTPFSGHPFEKFEETHARAPP